MRMINTELGLFKKFDDYLKVNNGRARPQELVDIVEEHSFEVKSKNNNPVDDFMSWLDCMIEDQTMDDALDDYLLLIASSHEKHVHEGYVRALKLVEEKAKEFNLKGF